MLTLVVCGCFPGRAHALDAAVRRVNWVAYLAADGSASVTEEWTVDFGEGGDAPFERTVSFAGDALRGSAGVAAASATLDGAVLEREDGPDARDGTWSVTGEGTTLGIRVNRVLTGLHTFSFRYDVYGCVKAYNSHAVCYLRLRDDDAAAVLQEATCAILLPQDCAMGAIRVLDSADLPAEKNMRGVTFRGVDVVGGVMLGLQMPLDLFERAPLTTVEDDDTARVVMRYAAIILGALALLAVVIVLVKRQDIYRRRRRKKAASHAARETDPAYYDRILTKISPAEVLTVTDTDTFSEADRFIVTALDLIRRGYLVPEGADFTYHGSSDRDDVRRAPEKHEREAIRLFTSGQWKRVARQPDEFAAFVAKFNRMIPGLKFTDAFRRDRRQLHEDCWRLVSGAAYREHIRPADVSDAIFRSDRYSAVDLLFSLINEPKRGKTYTSPEGLKDFFRFRNILESASLPSRKGAIRKQSGGKTR